MLAIAYGSRDVPLALMNLTLNNGIAGHKRVEMTMSYTHVLSVSALEDVLVHSAKPTLRNRIRQRAMVQEATRTMNKDWRKHRFPSLFRSRYTQLCAIQMRSNGNE